MSFYFKRFSKLLLSSLILLVNPYPLHADVGCKIIGGNTIYPTYRTFLLGVELDGVSLGIPSYIYRRTSPIYTDVSCLISWAYNVKPFGSGNCVYGTPDVNIPLAAAVCITSCFKGQLVEYSTTVECPLDDYSWAFGASAAALGVFVIRKRK